MPAHAGARTPLNEVVCGAMMLAYERGGKWNEVRPFRKWGCEVGIDSLQSAHGPNVINCNDYLRL
jgi:hypothetical protein